MRITIEHGRRLGKSGDNHFITLGQPWRNPALQQGSVQHPQPCQPDSDKIEQWMDKVVFPLVPDLSLGLGQLICLPWNEARAFPAATGTTDERVKGAVDVPVNHPSALQR